jgi:hypothetical protein
MQQADMFKLKNSENKTTTTIFRVVGWLLMWLGSFLLFSPIIALLKWIPLVGYLLGHIASFVVGIFTFVFSSTFSLLTIALAWVYYRPLFGCLLLLGVFCGIGLMFFV